MPIEKLQRAQTSLLVVDIQERLCSAMPQDRLAEMVSKAGAAIEGARILGLPILVTEQYPRGLGHTLPMLAERLAAGGPAADVSEKIEFTACIPGVVTRLAGRHQVLIVGMETHICVYQTVRDLVALGHLPVLCADAALSRSAVDHQVGLQLCRDAGGMVTSVESALFDLLGRAGTPEFKAISAVVK